MFLIVVVRAIRHDVGRAGENLGRGAEIVERAGHSAAIASSARLVVLEPGSTQLARGEELALQPITNLGRSGRNTIVLDDTYVSTDHAAIAYRDGTWWLTDKGSTNGTVVNERPITGDVALKPGDVIGVGRLRFRMAA